MVNDYQRAQTLQFISNRRYTQLGSKTNSKTATLYENNHY